MNIIAEHLDHFDHCVAAVYLKEPDSGEDSRLILKRWKWRQCPIVRKIDHELWARFRIEDYRPVHEFDMVKDIRPFAYIKETK